DMDALVRVLTEPKNAFVKQYQCLFKMEDVELEFTPDALEAAAELAMSNKTGARGLRTVLESTLLDIMYELPSMKGVSKCVVSADAIRGIGSIGLFEESGAEYKSPQTRTQKSA
ncbi:MAG: ATP-dependent Clp protease ATP-binding subunit ClpX, partial [SAR202 cluster bacterium]|nr:ATP-dependent Clp protease ATP-binding subunit ClpX [SAR202 cluster bacterium]